MKQYKSNLIADPRLQNQMLDQIPTARKHLVIAFVSNPVTSGTINRVDTKKVVDTFLRNCYK